MAPPPSQKGKFRPKKQKKTIRPGAALASSDAGPGSGLGSDAAARPSVAFATETRSNDGGDITRSSPRRSSYGGRGRGGGRGRTPAPQGQVFFQGGGGRDQSTSSATSASKNASGGGVAGTRNTSGGTREKSGGTTKRQSSSAAGARSGVVDLTTEEVVGELDVAVGGNAPENETEKKAAAKKKNTMTSGDDMDYEDAAQTDRGLTSITMMDNMYTYESDSSDDETKSRNQGYQDDRLKPVELPFSSTAPIPMDIESATTGNARPIGVESYQDEAPSSSPFVDVDDGNKLVKEKDAWFLVQLPTRLPPIKKKVSAEIVVSAAAGDQPDRVQSMQPDAIQSDLAPVANNIVSDVVTPPMVADSFDNQLAAAEPGRIGKIVVYKSGRTELVMRDEGGNEVRMEVNEGLTCAFHQQAVSVDAKEFVPLGEVKKSVVVSPHLKGIRF